MNMLHTLVIVATVAVGIAGWVTALASLSSGRLSIAPAARGLWIAAVLVFPVVGSVAWFAWGRPHFSPRATGSDPL
ncbi:hypothetical protein GCM10027413_05660 [Conyzicola nivalis]|uniref:PLDc N-terminal domain-containing protein n=1 Tax=Conyzicola nivalis TaxID=1477021 RepID=UPI001E4BF7E4|nr:PLDc N-terminal domain-containing protein [Conyzicola nivalis]